MCLGQRRLSRGLLADREKRLWNMFTRPKRGSDFWIPSKNGWRKSENPKKQKAFWKKKPPLAWLKKFLYGSGIGRAICCSISRISDSESPGKDTIKGTSNERSILGTASRSLK